MFYRNTPFLHHSQKGLHSILYRSTIAHIMRLPHFETAGFKNVTRKVGAVVGAVAIGGAIGYGGYSLGKGTAPEALSRDIPEATKIGCAAPLLIRNTMGAEGSENAFQANLVTKTKTSEKPILVTVADTSGKLLIPQLGFQVLQKNGETAGLVQSDAPIEETTIQFPLSDSQLSGTDMLNISFTTSSGKVVRCAPVKVGTKPVASPAPTFAESGK